MTKKIAASLVAAATFVACFPSLDHLEHDAAPSEVDGGPIEASTDAQPDAPPKECLVPKSVAAPAELASQMKFCDLEEMRTIDGATGGIYRDSSTTTVDVPGDPAHTVSSCAAFDFGMRVDPLSLQVVAKASKKTCGHQCNASLPPDAGCDSGDFIWVFAGPSLNVKDSKFVTEIRLQKPMSITETLTFDKAFPSVDVSYIFVCRANGGADRDDIEIDGIELCPR